MPNKRSMSQIYLLSLVIMATLPVAVLGYLWVSDLYREFDAQIHSWRGTYIDTQQQSLQRQVLDTINNLEFDRASIDSRQRVALKLAVDNGIAQLDSLLRFAPPGRTREQLLQRARDLLAPIRFGSGRDHYFIHTLDGVAVLMPVYPQWEGQNVLDRTDANNKHFVAQLAQLARQGGEGYLAVWYSQSDGKANAYLTEQYVRYYAPLDIYLGAVSYVDDMVASVQREELARLASAASDDTVLTVIDQSDKILLDRYDTKLQGKLLPATNPGNADLWSALRAAANVNTGKFLQVQRVHRESGESAPMVVYVRAYEGWHWRIGAGYFLDKFDASIAQQRAELQQRVNRRIVDVALLVLILMFSAVLVAHGLTTRTRRGMRSFANFFADASRNSTSIDIAQLPFVEFDALAADANRMIAQRSRIETALRLSEQRFDMALQVSGSYLWDMTYADGSMILSSGFLRLLGYAEESLHIDAEQWHSWVHPDDLDRLERAIERLQSPNNTYGVELRLRDSRGEYRWFLSRGGVVECDSAGNPQRALGTINEITERKRMEQELVAARIAAEDANHAKSQFLSSISHELRTPLNGVLGYAQILLRDQSTSAEQRHNLRAIESCGQHLLTLINDVLDLAKIESGKIEVQAHPCDLYDLLENVSNIVRERADSKGLSYLLEVDETVPAAICIDEVKLRQILVNLLGNAVKFTEHGTVTLRVLLHDVGEQLLFQVCDTGIGIPADKQQEIFHPFQQIGRVAGGTGLGLPISQRLCEAMGGSLTVQSAAGAGSCFSFSLPLQRSVQAELVRPPRAAYQVIDTGAQAITVMVVDDNPVNRQVLAGMLRGSGIGVVEAENGQDALDKLRARPQPLVLMDVRMPVMDGFAATRAIKADPQLRDTVVIAVSASVFPDVIARMRAQGCDDFVGKPVRVAELLAKVAEYLHLPLNDADVAPDDVHVPAVTRIPESLRDKLRAAVAVGDIEAMRGAMQPLLEGTPELIALARHIEHLLDNFDLDAVRDLLTPRYTLAS